MSRFNLFTTKSSKKNRSKKFGNGKTRGGGGLIGGGGPSASLTLNIEPWMPLFPAKTTKRLRYSTNIQLASTSGAVVSYVFAANGLFDPDVTGTGHQPMGFDQMMVQYNHYAVTYAKIKVAFKGISSTKMTACIRYDGGSTPITVIDRIVEQGGCAIDNLDATSVNGDQKLLWLSLDIAKIQGISASALTSDSTLRGDVASNPSELSYFHVQLWDAAGQTGSANIDVVLEQTSVFFEPRTQTESLQAIHRLVESQEEKQFVHLATKKGPSKKI